MAVENLPRWTFRPNWRSPVTERLSWLTGLLQSEEGAEQRFALRASPRRSFEALTTPIGALRTRFDLAVGKVGVEPWHLPLWIDRTTLAAELASGATTIPLDTTDLEFVVGGLVILYGSEGSTEICEVASVSPTEIEVVDPTSEAWPAGTLVYPCLKAMMTDQPSMTRFGSRIVENAIRFEVLGTNDYDAATLTDTYLTFPVLSIAPDEGKSLTHDYERLFDERDNLTGVRERVHTSDIGFTRQTHAWTAATRAERAALRAYFYALEGRLNPTWLPTFADDLLLVEEIEAADTAIVVQDCGFTEFGGPREGRRDVVFFLRDGTRIYRRITGSTASLGTETLVLNAAVGADLALTDVKRISFMALSRLDGDDVEFAHYTDSVCEVVATFRHAPDVRDADEWSPPVLPSSTMTPGACGEACTVAIAYGGEAFTVASGDPAGNAVFLYTGNATGLDAQDDFMVSYTNGNPMHPFIKVANVAAETVGTETDVFNGGSYSLTSGAVWVHRLTGGDLIVLSQQNDGATGDDEITAQRVDATGATVGSPFVAAGGAASGLRTLSMAGAAPHEGVGRFAIAFFDSDTDETLLSLWSAVDVKVYTDLVLLTGGIGVYGHFGANGLQWFHGTTGTYAFFYRDGATLKAKIVEESVGVGFSVIATVSVASNAANAAFSRSPGGVGIVYTDYVANTQNFIEIAVDGSMSTPVTLFSFGTFDPGNDYFDRFIVSFAMTPGGALVALVAEGSKPASDYLTDYSVVLFEPGTLAEVDAIPFGAQQVNTYYISPGTFTGAVTQSGTSGRFAVVARLQNAGFSNEEDVSLVARSVIVTDCTGEEWPGGIE